MPTSVGPNTFGEENLVFSYDLGDVSTSYKGEPATNSQDYDKSVMTQAGFDAWGCYDGNNSSPNYHYWGNAQSKTLVNIPGPDGKYVNAMLYHNFTGGFHGPTNWSGVASSLLTNGSKITVQGWVKAADAASVGKTVSPHLYYGKIGGGSYSSSTSYTLTAEWQLVSHSYTVPEGSTGTGTMYFFTSGGTNIKMYLTKTAIVGGRVHAIQWLPGGTTRSTTQGLLDLTGNSTINLINVSFDSNAKPTWDGTDDYIAVTRRQYGVNEAWTTELVFKPTDDADTSWNGLFGGGLAAGGYWMFHSAGNLAYYEGYDGTTRITYRGWTKANTFTAGIYHHLTITYTPTSATTGAYSLYYNGGEKTDSFNWTFGWSYSLDMQFIGAGDGRFGTNDIHYFKQYDRALTASEIKSNYNAIKGRFNI